jgi:outer membrane protein assembly factor BamB
LTRARERPITVGRNTCEEEGMLEMIRRALSPEAADRQPLRLLPGIVIVALQFFLWLVVPMMGGLELLGIGLMGGLAGGLAVLVWWVFFSRAPSIERYGAAALMAVSFIVLALIQDESMAASQMGLTTFFYAVPILSLAFVAWVVFARGLDVRVRRLGMAGVIVVSVGSWAFVRSEGMTSDIGHDFNWRLAASPVAGLADRHDEKMLTPSTEDTVEQPGADWPGFRGVERDGVVRGVGIATDWSAHPPVELWRRPIGQGFSSVAIRGNLVYTQEQRGDDEVVACYYLASGAPAWIHADKAKFLGADAHPGPRATPTLHGGRVYSFGATGILNALDARTGDVVWSREATRDVATQIPTWGLASSPLVASGCVIVDVGSTLVAYDLSTGEKRWSARGGTGYSSPHMLTIGGVPQVVMLSGEGCAGFSIGDGTRLWNHEWKQDGRILQPALTPDGGMLVGAVLKGVRRVDVSLRGGEWVSETKWTSALVKPNFNDMVVRGEYAYGFSGNTLVCLDCRTGDVAWSAGKCGGQLALLSDQGPLLVLTEKGELLLMDAKPEKPTEIARLKALTGKTWNHPSFAGDVLVVRNVREMAAYRLGRPR